MDPTIILERKLPGLDMPSLRDFVVKACRASGVEGSVTVLVTGNREIRRLNARFRAKNTPTDVLSFPAIGSLKGFLGDVAISADIARENARSLGHSLREEVRVLILHGILHLAGYDHETNHGEMAGKERRLRERLGLPPGLIERNALRRSTGRRNLPRTARSRP
jgi:probable rRNA maturation factor